jgi:Flp pilus assembly pilin Flp
MRPFLISSREERTVLAILAKLFCQEDGATPIEYGVIGALMSVAAITAAIAVMPLMMP